MEAVHTTISMLVLVLIHFMRQYTGYNGWRKLYECI